MSTTSGGLRAAAHRPAWAGARPLPHARAPAPQRPLAAARPPRSVVRPQAVNKEDDEIKEQSRKFRRTVFTFENWEVHRSTHRYQRHLLTMFSSRVVWGLQRPLLYVVAVASMVVAYETLLAKALIPSWLPSIQLNSKEPFGLTSFALSLLLVFRTNASYERWDGARKTWGLLLNRSRDLARQGLTYIPTDRPDLRAMMCRWTPAFARALLCHLRKDGDWRGELGKCLLPHEVDQVMNATHRPNYVLQVLSQIIRSAKCGTAPTSCMDSNLTAFEDCLGGCERILKTPVPLSYTRHTSRFLMIWLTLLPFALYGACGFATIPLCAIIAFLLLGIEEIGVTIEEPFSILALEAISDSAMNNVRELQAMHDLNPPAAGAPARKFTATELVAIAAEGSVYSQVAAAGAAATPAAAPPPVYAAANGNGHANGNGAAAAPAPAAPAPAAPKVNVWPPRPANFTTQSGYGSVHLRN